MKSLQKIGKHIIIVGIGVALAFLVAIMQYDAENFAASVLSLTEQDFFVKKNWDVGYKKENQIFEIFFSESMRNVGDLKISILNSPKDFQWNLDRLESDYTIFIESVNSDNLILSVSDYENGDFTAGILQIPFSGDVEDVTLEYVKSGEKGFIIGALDNIDGENH